MITLDKFENQARELLPKMIYDFYASGACDEITLNLNRETYNHIHLIPRILKDTSQRSLSTRILNNEISFPAIIAPTSYHGMATAEAEIATARAAKDSKTIMTVSTMSNTPLENIALEHPEGIWFQLYILNDRPWTLHLVERIEQAGYQAIVLTVDSQILGIRERDIQNNFALPEHLKLANLITSAHPLEIKANSQNLFDKKLTWDDIEWLRAHTKLPIILKGILHKEDAKIAMSHGIDGIIVSNHGGRQLDTAIPSILALPEIVNVVSRKIPILIDGGIRRGTDIIKAIALGASAVLIGRPIIWGLAANNSEGASKILSILRHEFDTAMGLCGFSSIQELQDKGHEIIHWNKNQI